MKEVCAYASYDQIGAIFVPGLLVLWASGTTPNQFYTAKIKPSLYLIYPPHFDLLQCSGEIVPDLYDPTPYKTFASFPAGNKPAEDYVPINTAEGTIRVPLFIPEFGPAPVDSNLTIAGAGGGGGAMPSPLTAAGTGEGIAPPSPFSVPGAFKSPIGLSKVFETGNSEDVIIPVGLEGLKKVEAVGYSESFSFDEAFQDALRRLPPDDNIYPDKLTTIHVDAVGAQFGGIAGFRRMTVTVSTTR